MSRYKGYGFVWLVAGLGLGAGVTYLFTTKSGKKARRYVSRMAEDGRERLTESGQEVLERGKALYERGKEMADEAIEFIDRSRRAIQK
ncbi:MAG: YtxH domain-containing protein [Acidobacteria bacterium]|nr:YtxH domain-containing protein [Acidobacteriota bacterium]